MESKYTLRKSGSILLLSLKYSNKRDYLFEGSGSEISEIRAVTGKWNIIIYNNLLIKHYSQLLGCSRILLSAENKNENKKIFVLLLINQIF